MRLSFQQSHDDRRGNVVRKIGYNLEGLASEYAVYVAFQDILVDDSDIVILRKGFFQHRDKLLVYLHRYHLACGLCQILGKGSDSRSYLQHVIFGSYLRSPDYLIDNMAVYQEVLSEGFLEIEIVLLYNFYGLFRIT